MSYDQTKKIATRFFIIHHIFIKMFGARALPRAVWRARICFPYKIQKCAIFDVYENILHWRAPDSARKCARAQNVFRIVKFMKFPTFYVFWIFSYLLNWFLWMALKCVVFSRKIRFFLENFQKFLKFWKFSKKSNFQKKISNFKLL